MRKAQQYRGESLRRIQQFLDAHVDVFGQLNASDARKELDAAVSQLSASVNIQLSRERAVRGTMRLQESLERDLRDHHVIPVVNFARGRLATAPNVGALTPSTRSLKGARLVNAARAMAEAAKPYADQFTAASFPLEFMAQLLAAADAVEASIDARGRQRAERINGTAAVETQLKAGRSAALMLEGAVGRLVPRSSALYAEWRGIRRLFRPGSRKDAVVPPAQVPAGIANGAASPAGKPSDVPPPAVKPSDARPEGDGKSDVAVAA
jgi:hypothetical protein